ncbi:reverse transcriptase [Gossypium australe]|uniref:Reverse transcriptase n=1 Tax=Gossypium australe TaxID=47621 RepID=A0A5B6VY99_9ROSI|nr:reverse transcriptase [Gossypium australe]
MKINDKLKGKGIVHKNGSKPILNILKPSNRMGSSSSGLTQKPFDDGSRMGRIILDKDLEPILFQANNLVLNRQKHVVVRFGEKSTELAGNEQNIYNNLGILNQSMVSRNNQQQCRKIGRSVREKTWQEPMGVMDGESADILVMLAVENILQRLDNVLEGDIAMIGGVSDKAKEERKSSMDEGAIGLTIKRLRRLGLSKVNELGKYLGVSFFHNRVSIDTFQFILDKVCNQLNGWET